MMECRCINNYKQATLSFERKELLADIKGNAYTEWDTMKSENEHARHMVADICDDGNIERVTRVLDLTFAHAVELCLPYARRELRHIRNIRDNEYEEEEEYVMQMTVPDTFSETTLTLLEKLIHELLVSTVLADWLSQTKPESAASWAAKAASYESEITSALTHRCKPIARKISPL